MLFLFNENIPVQVREKLLEACLEKIEPVLIEEMRKAVSVSIDEEGKFVDNCEPWIQWIFNIRLKGHPDLPTEEQKKLDEMTAEKDKYFVHNVVLFKRHEFIQKNQELVRAKIEELEAMKNQGEQKQNAQPEEQQADFVEVEVELPDYVDPDKEFETPEDLV